ncbi:phosphoribosylformylglycinamidine synthase subunit PurQ [Treponema sp.]
MPFTASPIRRVYVEKRPGFNTEALRLLDEITEFLGAQYPEIALITKLRILHRYDVALLDENQFKQAIEKVFSEPQCDQVYVEVCLPTGEKELSVAVEYLRGQYDQKADSAEQCIELIAGLRARVRCARVYLFASEKTLGPAALAAIKQYLINPVDSQEASLDLPSSLDDEASDGPPVPLLKGFKTAGDAELSTMAKTYGLAMSHADLLFCRDHFCSIGRDPSLAELRVLDTYWSDHCRHSTFTTELNSIEISEGEDASRLQAALDLYERSREEAYGTAANGAQAKTRKRSLMDLATIGTKVLKKRGLTADIEESAEINACSVHITAQFEDGSEEPWLLMFKNETHNHPTEIEPFGGAATCLGGAIRDPLSGRAYVHQAMRVSGGADPRQPLSATLEGKLPQLKIAREAAAGYSSYGNQIGLATGQVAEFYHSGFLAKRMELGAVIGAVPQAWVRREEPALGDIIILLGGATGRDGIGGATGSSKAHTEESVKTAGAEVQKGNAPEERKIQRLFRNPEVTRLIKRCNDFGAGGVSVAIGELAAGLDIDLDAVPKKYAGLDGIELAISESQERMAVVVEAKDVESFIDLAHRENLNAVVVAKVTAVQDDSKAHLRMSWRGDMIVDLERAFLDSNGASRQATARLVSRPKPASGFGATTAVATGTDPVGTELAAPELAASVYIDQLERELRSLRSGSRRGLQERFDGSIGALTVLYPFGGTEQATPECGMAAKLPSLGKDSTTASLMSFGYDPEFAIISPYRAAKGAIREALAKFACMGGDPFSARLSFQEYFERTSSDEAWGKPLQALLGALEAQIELGIPAIGGKDSMSGSYRDPANGRELTVPPTLVAFAAGVAPLDAVRSGVLSGKAGNLVVLLVQETGADEWNSFRAHMKALSALTRLGLVRSAYPVGSGGLSTSLALMAFGNASGIEMYAEASRLVNQENYQGSILIELDGTIFSSCAAEASSVLDKAALWYIAARLVEGKNFRVVTETEEMQASHIAEAPLAELRRAFEYPLNRVYPQTSSGARVAELAKKEDRLDLPFWTEGRPNKRAGSSAAKPAAKPLVILPAFPGTNCEWDMERAFRHAGAATRIVIFRNRTQEDIRESTLELAKAIGEAQILALSGGFSAGDEPDGSGKFIANALRASLVEKAVTELLEKRDGLAIGICNGFQALIKLGLVPFGEYRDADEAAPTLTYNAIGRHVSRIVRTRVMSKLSPWLALDNVGSIHAVPVSHGEGRLAVAPELGKEFFQDGRAAFCYVDAEGYPTMAEPDNPNGSAFAIEGLTSGDGRVLGKMAHSERYGHRVLMNIAGNKEQNIFKAGIAYFT